MSDHGRDQEGESLDDHGVPADLLELYEVLEYVGQIELPEEQVGIRSLGDGDRVVTRAMWRARSALSRTGLADPEGNTAHYEGPHMGEFPHDSCATKVRGIQAFHMDSRGWNDIAYSSLVCPHGYVYVGRWWNTRTAANGTNDGNARSYAHCYLGGVDDAFTEEAKRAMKTVFAMAVGTGAGSKQWVHSDWKATACPGGPVRDWVKSGMPVSNDPPPPPPPEPPPTPGVDPDVAAIDNLPRIETGSAKAGDPIYKHFVRTLQALMFVHQMWPAGTDFNTTVDGDFGPKTKYSLAAWQDRAGLKSQGEQGFVGPKTWRFLYGL